MFIPTMSTGNHPKRFYPAKQAWVSKGNRSVIVFITVCTKNRKHILARPEIHGLLLQSWATADTWSVGSYMVLPDHIHLFCSPAKHDAPNVKRWVGYWKSLSSKNWPYPSDKPVWQRDC
jgi:putative transposase